MQGLFGLVCGRHRPPRSPFSSRSNGAAAACVPGATPRQPSGSPTCPSPRTSASRPALEGHAGPLVVGLESYRRGKYEHGTRVEIGGLGHAGLVDVRAEGVGSQFAKAFGDREIALGDADFDRVAYVQGSPSMVRAVLGADARRALGPLFSGHFAERPGVSARTVRTILTDSRLRVDIREQRLRRPRCPHAGHRPRTDGRRTPAGATGRGGCAHRRELR